MITNGSPWASRRIGHEVLDEVLRQFLLTLWNVYAFFVTYATAEGFDPVSPAPPSIERPVLDRWILSRLSHTVTVARDGLEAYDATGAGRAIQAFVDDLSNWYVRRARRRFWNPGGAATDDAAFHTLYECLVTVATLLAPFTPFVSEELWRNLAAGRDGRPDSVHLADYPEADGGAGDEELDAAMAGARAVVSLGRTIRADTKTKVRQPLAEAVVHYPGDHTARRAPAGPGRRGTERAASRVRGVRRPVRPVAGEAELQGARAAAGRRRQGSGRGLRERRRHARRHACRRRPGDGRDVRRRGRALPRRRGSLAGRAGGLGGGERRRHHGGARPRAHTRAPQRGPRARGRARRAGRASDRRPRGRRPHRAGPGV